MLKQYYRYWERRIYNAIVRMTVASIVTFQGLLNIDVLAKVAGADGEKLGRRRPLVLVNVTHNLPHLVVSPEPGYIARYLSRTVEFLCRSASHFMRWMDGSCVPAMADLREDEDAPDFSYYQDMVSNQEVVGAMVAMDPAVVGMI